MTRLSLLNKFCCEKKKQTKKQKQNNQAYKHFCVNVVRKAKKCLFDNLNVKCITDNKTFQKVIKPTSLINHQKMKKITLVD